MHLESNFLEKKFAKILVVIVLNIQKFVRFAIKMEKLTYKVMYLSFSMYFNLIHQIFKFVMHTYKMYAKYQLSKKMQSMPSTGCFV